MADTAALLRADDRIRLVTISQVLREVFSLRPREHAMPLDTLTAEGATALYDGMAATMMRATEPGRRQLIVAFTDGRDSTSIIDEKTAKEIARLTDAVVDIVVPVAGARGGDGNAAACRSAADRSIRCPPADNVASGGRGAPNRTGDPDVPRVLSRAGRTNLGTGVSAWRATIPSASVFKAMLDDFRASYVLQYVPQGVADEGWHDVAVAVKKHPKYDIRARKGYRGRSKITRIRGDPVMRIARLTVCGAAMVLALGAVRPAGWQQPTFKSATALVEVDAVVLDKNGNFVPGLKPENITLLENGKPQKIQQFFMVTNNLGQAAGRARQRSTPTRPSTARIASS